MTSKRKTKQLRWLVTRLMLAMTMVMPTSTWAQEQVMYTVFKDGTLRFMYGEKPGSGIVYDVPNNPNNTIYSPGWLETYSKSITTVDFDKSFKNARPTSCYRWFFDCSNLTSINNIENLNTEKVTNMSYMFCKCEGLTSLNLSNFDTSNVTYMTSMFYNCSGLKSLDLSNFDTSNVTTMYQLFYDCSSLTSLNLSSFNTSNVTDMATMFNNCPKLTSLDLSNFNTANVTRMTSMFNNCSGLTSLNLSSFNTAKVQDMYQMFYGCSGLTTIYVSDDFTTDKVSNSNTDQMFYNCTSLKGAASHSEDKTDKSMANYNTGYFKTYYELGGNKVELCGKQLTTESLNLTGEKDFVAHAPFTANKANYYRDLSTSGSTWFSLCLPFAYTPNNFTAYKLKGASANAVEIEEITTKTIDAGTPVLFKFKDGVKNEEKKINISANKAEIVKAPVDVAKVTGPDGSSLQLCGTYQTKTFSKDADGNAFILLNNKLMNPAKMLATGVTTVGVKPFRAYMTLTASTESSAQTSSARAFSIGRGDEGNEGTTAIALLNSVATDDAEYYDINGRRIDAPVKGVNIVRRGNKTMKLIIK